jgi:tetratricopeptide (TPR) repeat protein
MRMKLFKLVPTLLIVTTANAQTASEHISLGDRDYVAMKAPDALAHYEAAAKLDPSSYEAFWKASRSAIDIGSYSNDKRAALFASGEQYARRAVALNPARAEGHFSMARALGKTALSQSPKGRIKYATEIRSQALECLRIDPKHPGCLHVMGMWNAEVMRLNGFTRMIAKNFLGGKVFGSANWNEAVRYMEASVASEPDRIVHHLDLGYVYRDVNRDADAGREFEKVLSLSSTDVNDRFYKEEARSAIEHR